MWPSCPNVTTPSENLACSPKAHDDIMSHQENPCQKLRADDRVVVGSSSAIAVTLVLSFKSLAVVDMNANYYCRRPREYKY